MCDRGFINGNKKRGKKRKMLRFNVQLKTDEVSLVKHVNQQEAHQEMR